MIWKSSTPTRKTTRPCSATRRGTKSEQLREVTKQGALDPAPEQGFSTPTEGSRWIVSRAQVEDPRPLWILGWGCLTDVAQAVHDAPGIKQKIRVHSTGSWNTKEDPAARQYLFESRKDLWMKGMNTAAKISIK